MVRNLVGSPARGEDFFDREELVDRIWEELEINNILLAAPRRFGKTSIMYSLLDRPRKGWEIVHLDAESVTSPVKFIIMLIETFLADKKIRKFLLEAWNKTSGWARNFAEEIQFGSFDVNVKIRMGKKIKSNWQEKGEELFSKLRNFDGKTKLLIIIDELPMMLQLFEENDISSSETRVFLNWFRKLRIDPKIGLNNCRFLIGGSIGIDSQLTVLNASSSFNDFEKLFVGALDVKKSLLFIGLLLSYHNIRLSEQAKREILNLIGEAIPYFIQIFVNEIASDQLQKQRTLGVVRIREIYENRILSTNCKTYFNHYYNRLREYHKISELAAKNILRELALVFPEPKSKDSLYRIYKGVSPGSGSRELFVDLMVNLENDFYVIYHKSEGYQFASKILCDWWRRYYAF